MTRQRSDPVDRVRQHGAGARARLARYGPRRERHSGRRPGGGVARRRGRARCRGTRGGRGGAGAAPTSSCSRSSRISSRAVLPTLRAAAARGRCVSFDRGRQDDRARSARVSPRNAAIVRAMPNTPAAIGKGMTALVANAAVSGAQRALCGELLAAVGAVAWLDDERHMDAVTAISGSGPAYVFLLIECLEQAAIDLGLDAALAKQLAHRDRGGRRRIRGRGGRGGSRAAPARDEPERHDSGGARRADGRARHARAAGACRRARPRSAAASSRRCRRGKCRDTTTKSSRSGACSSTRFAAR